MLPPLRCASTIVLVNIDVTVEVQKEAKAFIKNKDENGLYGFVKCEETALHLKLEDSHKWVVNFPTDYPNTKERFVRDPLPFLSIGLQDAVPLRCYCNAERHSTAWGGYWNKNVY